MPKLVGLSIEDAKKRIENAKLNEGHITYQESDKPKGEVLEQNIAPETEVETGTLIHLIVSQGSDKLPPAEVVKLSNYSGQHIDDVKRELGQLNIRYAIIPEYSDDQPNGYIIKTYPEAGSDVLPSTEDAEGTVVNIYVSQGSKNKETEPPVTETEPPAITTAPPAIQTEPPVITTVPPATQTEPPVITTAPPAIQTEPPAVVTDPPASTEEPPAAET